MNEQQKLISQSNVNALTTIIKEYARQSIFREASYIEENYKDPNGKFHFLQTIAVVPKDGFSAAEIKHRKENKQKKKNDLFIPQPLFICTILNTVTAPPPVFFPLYQYVDFQTYLNSFKVLEKALHDYANNPKFFIESKHLKS